MYGWIALGAVVTVYLLQRWIFDVWLLNAQDRWNWKRQPKAPGMDEVQEEIKPALVMCDFASKRLCMYMSNGTDVMKAIDYARRKLDEAENHIFSVDPEKRPQPAFNDME